MIIHQCFLKCNPFFEKFQKSGKSSDAFLNILLEYIRGQQKCTEKSASNFQDRLIDIERMSEDVHKSP